MYKSAQEGIEAAKIEARLDKKVIDEYMEYKKLKLEFRQKWRMARSEAKKALTL